MHPPEISSDATTSQANVNNPDLHVIQQTLSSLNTGAPRSSLPPFSSFDPIKIVQLSGNAGENGSTDFKIYSVQGNKVTKASPQGMYVCMYVKLYLLTLALSTK